jgi:hypothetical protein
LLARPLTTAGLSVTVPVPTLTLTAAPPRTNGSQAPAAEDALLADPATPITPNPPDAVLTFGAVAKTAIVCANAPCATLTLDAAANSPSFAVNVPEAVDVLLAEPAAAAGVSVIAPVPVLTFDAVPAMMTAANVPDAELTFGAVPAIPIRKMPEAAEALLALPAIASLAVTVPLPVLTLDAVPAIA